MPINQKKNSFLEKIIIKNINQKAIIHKCAKFEANILKNKKTVTYMWTTTTQNYEVEIASHFNCYLEV